MPHELDYQCDTPDCIHYDPEQGCTSPASILIQEHHCCVYEARPEGSGRHQADICPKCGCGRLNYGTFVHQDDGGYTPWDCPQCGAGGRACADLIFTHHIIDGEELEYGGME